jgi:Fe-S-cluster containining protein
MLPTGEPVWFGEGLRFRCTGCGRCCTGSSGSVNVTREDVARLAEHHGQTAGAFSREYTRRLNGRRVLVNRPGGTNCIFLKNNACSVYEARPVQCRTYPWWLANIQDAESWAETAKACEGIDHPTAVLVPLTEILVQCERDIENDGQILSEQR